MSRCLASLPGVHTGACSPASSVLSRHCDFLSALPPRFVAFARRCHGNTWLFAPAAATCVERRAWGWSSGIPVRDCFRGDDRSSQVPGEPQFPFAHVLRPRPADVVSDQFETIAWPSLRERRRRRQHKTFEAQSHGFRGHGLRIAMLVARHRARLASRCWSGSPGRACTRRAPVKSFQLTSCSLSSFPKLLGTIPFSFPNNQ